MATTVAVTLRSIFCLEKNYKHNKRAKQTFCEYLIVVRKAFVIVEYYSYSEPCSIELRAAIILKSHLFGRDVRMLSP